MKPDSDESAMNLTVKHCPEAYSPNVVEGAFSEVHIQHYA
jgi:hypothetical protein